MGILPLDETTDTSVNIKMKKRVANTAGKWVCHAVLNFSKTNFLTHIRHRRFDGGRLLLLLLSSIISYKG